MKLLEFLERVYMVSLEVPFSVTSWIRTTKRNTMVGGHPSSRHLIGRGIDGVLDNPNDESRLIERFEGAGIKVIIEKDHFHLQPFIITTD